MSDNCRWRIERLAELAGQVLAAARCDGQVSGRVREVPDVRTIRYYTTLGLIDRPLEMQGRVAFYGRHHLLQLVAIKRLQAQGVSLVDIQQRLVGIGDRRLATLADLPTGFLLEPLASEDAGPAAKSKPVKSKPVKGMPAKDKVGTAFWARTPMAACESSQGSSAPATPSRPVPAEATGTGTLPAVATTAMVLRVAEGVHLLIEGVEPGRLDRAVLGELEPAVAHLREAIHRAGLLSKVESNRGSSTGSTRESGNEDAGRDERDSSKQENGQ